MTPYPSTNGVLCSPTFGLTKIRSGRGTEEATARRRARRGRPRLAPRPEHGVEANQVTGAAAQVCVPACCSAAAARLRRHTALSQISEARCCCSSTPAQAPTTSCARFIDGDDGRLRVARLRARGKRRGPCSSIRADHDHTIPIQRTRERGLGEGEPAGAESDEQQASSLSKKFYFPADRPHP